MIPTIICSFGQRVETSMLITTVQKCMMQGTFLPVHKLFKDASTSLGTLHLACALSFTGSHCPLANSYSAFVAPTHTPILGRSLWAALGDRICVFVPALVAGLRVNLILQDSKLPEVCALGLNRYHV